VARVELCTHLAYRKGEDGNPPPVHRRARALSQQPMSEAWESCPVNHERDWRAGAITGLHFFKKNDTIIQLHVQVTAGWEFWIRGYLSSRRYGSYIVVAGRRMSKGK